MMKVCDRLKGLVIRLQAGFYYVETDLGLYVCSLRGKMKRGSVSEDIVAVGDRVQITRVRDGIGAIDVVEARSRVFERLAPTPRGEYRQILLANPEQLVLVFSCAQPSPHLRMLDRFLVIAEKQNIPVLIVANKIDLVGLEKAGHIFSIYPPLGYPLLFTSTLIPLGIDELRQRLKSKISALAGPSGVGKTSLLNAVQMGLGKAVGMVSRGTENKGRHTTVVRELFPVEGGGYVADMPGLRSLALWDVQPEELDGYFPELRSLVAHCQFNDCTHISEPGCAVRAAVGTGEVHPERYESYLRIRGGKE